MLSITFWEANPTFYLVSALIFGLLIGSFLNVVILRLPVMMERNWRSECQDFLGIEEGKAQPEPFTLVSPPSTCPGCGHRIRAWENIPIASYLMMRGRCSSCEMRISSRYPLVEFICGLLTAGIAYTYGVSLLALAVMFFTWALLVLTVIDIDHQLLPDGITLPLMWLGLIVNSNGLLVPLDQAVWGAAAGYLSLWSVYWLFKLLTGKEGMGHGDFKLLAALGAWMGWQALIMIILLSSVVGAVIGIGMILTLGRDRNKPMPFGPYLAVAGWCTLVWNEQITDFYFKIAGI